MTRRFPVEHVESGRVHRKGKRGGGWVSGWREGEVRQLWGSLVDVRSKSSVRDKVAEMSNRLAMCGGDWSLVDWEIWEREKESGVALLRVWLSLGLCAFRVCRRKSAGVLPFPSRVAAVTSWVFVHHWCGALSFLRRIRP